MTSMRLHSIVGDRLIRAQKTGELRAVFEKGLKVQFGACDYENYKKIIARHHCPSSLPVIIARI